MRFYVYIIQSLVDNSFYKGFSTDFLHRLQQHNEGRSRYTSIKKPWKLVYVEECPDKKTALIREKSLKRSNAEYLRWMISSDKNILNSSKNT